MTKEKKLISNITGWIGMLFIQSSTLPVTYKVLMGVDEEVKTDVILLVADASNLKRNLLFLVHSE